VPAVSATPATSNQPFRSTIPDKSIMAITEDIFRAYDIRGIVETALTPEVVR
jgi:phosphomannomutase